MGPTPEILGFMSAAICSASVVPQIVKSWKTGSSKDISTPMILLTYVSMTLGITYGFLIRHVAVYVGNSVTLVLFAVLHVVKIRNERVREPEQEQALVEV